MDHKKQHYIPKCYLKAWCDPGCPPGQTPYIWVFEKESRTGKRKAPDNIFHETDMYTLWDEEGGRNLEIEHGLSQLEDQFSIIRKKKLQRRHGLERAEHFLMCVFIAAIHARTKNQLRRLGNLWREPLEMMNRMAERMEVATEEEKRTWASLSSVPSSKDRKGFTLDQVRAMAEDPVGTMLLPMIQAEVTYLPKLDFAVFYTGVNPGFITSDTPCVWHDAEAYKMPPLYRVPTLSSETIEVLLPISPTQCFFLNRRGMNGYQYVPGEMVREVNRLIRFNASEYYVVNRNFVDDFWFDPGVEPENSWEKEQAEKNTNNTLKDTD
jgi:Protein of unknown function (DUF4238)